MANGLTCAEDDQFLPLDHFLVCREKTFRFEDIGVLPMVLAVQHPPDVGEDGGSLWDGVPVEYCVSCSYVRHTKSCYSCSALDLYRKNMRNREL